MLHELQRDARALRRVATAAVRPYRPLLVALTVTRRCNLACSYCFEFDHRSAPVPLGTLRERLEHLARLKTTFVTFNGGEPLLHPHLVELVGAARSLGMGPMVNTNGFLLTREIIEGMNESGLMGLQLSIDAREPSPRSRKALSLLRPKLDLLREHANFRVRVNTVLGDENAAEVVEVVRAVCAYGFDAQCSLQRDASGAVMPLSEEAQAAYLQVRALRGRLPIAFRDDFQLPLARGEAVHWKCRSGARFFHVDEGGLVHPCQPRDREGGVPLEDYDRAHIAEAFHAHKPCSTRCGHAYAHIGSRLDTLRSQS